MTPDFVAAVLEGFEGTLDEILDRLAEGELRREIKTLQRFLLTKRQQITEIQDAPPAGTASVTSILSKPEKSYDPN